MREKDSTPTKSWREQIEVHPAAAIFPMMTEEELQELAADIKAHGLAHPIVIHQNGDGRELIDGRNRLRACEIAGVEPTFTVFDGEDPRAFILSANVARRHLSKGQQAMAVAMLYPEPEKGGRGKKALETSGFSRQRLGQARSVLAYSRPIAEAVLAGTTKLDAAYTQARAGSGKISDDADRLRELRKSRPDLVDQVDSDELTIDQAEDRAKRDEAGAREQRLTIFLAVREAIKSLAVLAFVDDLPGLIDRHVDEFKAANPLGMKFLAERQEHVPQGTLMLKGARKLIGKLGGQDDDEGQ